MKFLVDNKHNLKTSNRIIGVDDENYAEKLEFELEDNSFWDYTPYLEFRTMKGDTYSTSALKINEGKIEYEIPNGLLKEGLLTIQLILRKRMDDKDYVWKSFIKTMTVTPSINADKDIKEKYPDFITEIQQVVENLNKYIDALNKVNTMEEGAQVNRIETISKNGISLPITNKNINIDLSEYSLGSEAGANFLAEIDNTTYVLTFKLLNREGTILKQQEIDLPIESLIINGRYDAINKSLILTLQNGNDITIPIGALINGLQEEITSTNKLDSDLIDDSKSSNKFVTQIQKNKLDNIEPEAQVNKIEKVLVNNIPIIISNKEVNLDLTPYLLKEDIVPVDGKDIKALFNSEEGE